MTIEVPLKVVWLLAGCHTSVAECLCIKQAVQEFFFQQHKINNVWLPRGIKPPWTTYLKQSTLVLNNDNSSTLKIVWLLPGCHTSVAECCPGFNPWWRPTIIHYCTDHVLLNGAGK